ncbi:MAG: hypothetical protein HY526_04730 [Betaproteobacteria bacterium]|nr:hypothetical protein [Betaproteobacteria bacterium]
MAQARMIHAVARTKTNSHAGLGEQRSSYTVDHSTGIFVFDFEARARLYFSANERSVAAIVHDVNVLLEEAK